MSSPIRHYSSLPPKILQFGGGNFLRAFSCWMVQKLNDQTAFEGGVILVKPTPKGDYHRLRKQGGKYHVVLNGIQAGGKQQQTVEKISCISQIVNPYQEWESFLETAKIASVRFIISNTTEAGICFREELSFLDGVPEEFPGKLTAWLFNRFQYFRGDPNKGCVHLPCELIPNNGQALKMAVLQYAKHWNLGEPFCQWIENSNYFCETLVDRIVSGYSEELAVSLADEIGYVDENMVVGESYHSWVIQGPEALKDTFPFLHPELGVEWVTDISVYRERKLRVLNGAHTAMVPLGHLLGLGTVREVMGQPVLSQFISDLLTKEVVPTLALGREEAMFYVDRILDRFQNPFLHHRLLDISLNSISKFRSRLIPTLLDYHRETGMLPSRILFACLGLILYYNGSFGGNKIPLRDAETQIRFFAKAWEEYNPENPEVFFQDILGNPEWESSGLGKLPGLISQLSKYLGLVNKTGIEGTLIKLIQN